MIKKIVFGLMLIASVMSCTNSKQPATEQQEMAVDTTYILPSPNLDLVIYAKEDVGNVVDKVKSAFKLDGEPIKGDGKLSFTKTNAGIKIEYHIITSDNPSWFDYFTISFSSDKPTAFDELQSLTDLLNNQYKNSQMFEWDDERLQWTDGKQYIYIQKPTRDEKTGEVYAVVSIMPKDIEK